MSIFGDYENDSELMLILKQLAFGTAIGMAFLVFIYLGGLFACLISGGSVSLRETWSFSVGN